MTENQQEEKRMKSKTGKALIAIALIGLTLPSWAGEKEWDAHMKSGQAAEGKNDFAGAERYFKAAVAEAEKTYGPSHPRTAESLSRLGEQYFNLGRLAEAGQQFKRSLAIREKALGPSHGDVAESLNNLAVIDMKQGRLSEAEQLFKRSLAIREKVFGVEGESVALSLAWLAELYRIQDRHAEAEPLLKRRLAIQEKLLGSQHPSLAQDIDNLARIYQLTKRNTEAEALYKRNLDLTEKAFGAENENHVAALTNLAQFYHALGRLDEAEPHYKRALSILEKTRGQDDEAVAYNSSRLAVLYLGQGRPDAALAPMRRSTRYFTTRFNQTAATSDQLLSAVKARAGYFEAHVRMLAAAGRAAGSAEKVAAESFEVAQWALAADNAEQVARLASSYVATLAARMAERKPVGGGEVGRMLSERKSLLARYNELSTEVQNKRLADILKPAAEKDTARIDALAKTRDEIGTKLIEIDGRIAREFALYGEMIHPRPLSMAAAQNLLGPEEALLLLLVGREESYLWVLRRDNARFVSAAFKQADLEKGMSSDALYDRVIAPVEAQLAGAKSFILVGDAQLSQKLSIALWGRHKTKSGVSVLPSVKSLRSVPAEGSKDGPARDPQLLMEK
jgi:tetratricopeptide (TPR) repeat protein